MNRISPVELSECDVVWIARGRVNELCQRLARRRKNRYRKRERTDFSGLLFLFLMLGSIGLSLSFLIGVLWRVDGGF